MKGIYEVIDGKIYRLQQKMGIPTSIAIKPLGVSTNLTIDKATSTVEQNVFINTIKRNGLKSNRELYFEMVDKIKKEKITEVTPIGNFFKVYIEYTLFEDDRPIETSAVIRPVMPLDQGILLGVATNNECVYRQVKTFSQPIDFKTRNTVPYGIMMKRARKYRLEIHNIALFQGFGEPEIHESEYSNPYKINSVTINESINDMVMVYSSENEGIKIQPVDLTFIPRMVSIRLDLTMSDYIVAYNTADIDALIQINIKNKYDPDPEPIVPDPDDPYPVVPKPDENPDSDGNEEPDDEGYFNWYERCNSTTPKAKVVVEDAMKQPLYDPTTMVHKYKVKKDIPDIEVGEYVIYREAIMTDGVNC